MLRRSLPPASTRHFSSARRLPPAARRAGVLLRAAAAPRRAASFVPAARAAAPRCRLRGASLVCLHARACARALPARPAWASWCLDSARAVDRSDAHALAVAGCANPRVTPCCCARAVLLRLRGGLTRRRGRVALRSSESAALAARGSRRTEASHQILLQERCVCVAPVNVHNGAASLLLPPPACLPPPFFALHGRSRGRVSDLTRLLPNAGQIRLSLLCVVLCCEGPFYRHAVAGAAPAGRRGARLLAPAPCSAACVLGPELFHRGRWL